MEDQTVVIQANQRGKRHFKGFSIIDEPDYPITDILQAIAKSEGHPNKQAGIIRAFCRAHGCGKKRLFRGETPNKAASLLLKDRQGHTRLVPSVRPNGAPILQFPNANGKVIGQIPHVRNPSH
jgi:succinate dehydrogenase/fumarate reductase-like Fe-S protein